MDRSKTPTPAAILQQAQLKKQQQQQQEQQEQQADAPSQHRAAGSDSSSGAVTPSGQPAQSSTSFFGWMRSAIAPINPLSAVLGAPASDARPHSPSSTVDKSARSQTRKHSSYAEDGDDDDDQDKTARKVTQTSRRSSSSTDFDTSTSDAEDSGNEEIFTPFHKTNRAHSPVSPSSALKRLPFGNHMRRSSSPAQHVPGTVAAVAASATATALHGLPGSAQAGGAAAFAAAPASGGGGPRLFKPSARREALVLDQSTPIDELDRSSSFSSPTADTNPQGSRSPLPSLILTPPAVKPSRKNTGDRVGTEVSSLTEMMQSNSQQHHQQLSADASFELESLEKIRIDMETPDNTNQHREMVAFGQAVADMRATPKPFSGGSASSGSTSVASSPEEELVVEEPPVDSRATPKPGQQMRGSHQQQQQQLRQQQQQEPSLQSGTNSPRSRNIFRRNANPKSLELNTVDRRNGATLGDLSPTLLGEIDEPVEELGTPSSSGMSPSAEGMFFSLQKPGETRASRRSASEADPSSSLAAKSKVSRSSSSSGSFWKFNRNKKRPTSGSEAGSGGGGSHSEAGHSSGGILGASEAMDMSRATSSSSAQLSVGDPDSSASSVFSYDEQGSPLPSDLPERRGSILSLASSSGGGGGGETTRTNPDATKLRFSIDESSLPGRRAAAEDAEPESQSQEPLHRRVQSMESLRSSFGKAKSSPKKGGKDAGLIGGVPMANRPGSVMSVGSMGGLDKGTVKEAGKLSVKLWPKAVKMRFRGKPAKERDFETLVLAQELYLGWDPLPPKGRPSEPSRRLSFASSVDSGHSHAPGPGASALQSPSSTHSGVDPMSPAGSAFGISQSNSLASLARSVSGSSASGGAGLPSASGSVPSLGTAPASRPGSIMGGTSANGGSSKDTRPRKSTWAMRFSMDGRYFAVAGQDCVVRVYEVLSVPEQRQAEIDAALLATGHGLGTGGSTTSLGSHHASESGFASSVASTDSFATAPGLPGPDLNNGRGSVKSNSSSRSARKAAKLQANATNRAIPVFTSKPIREFRGHTADVIELSWSKNNFLMSASTDKTARLWHVTRPECLCTFGHMDFVTGACFHPTDDRFFLSASLDGKLRLWNIPEKKVQYSAEVPGLITACAFTASGKTACAGTFGGAIVLYHTDKLTYSTSIAVRAATSKSTKGSKVTGIEPVPNFGSNHERILVSSNDSRIRIYDLGDKSVAHKFKASGYHNKASQIRASISTDGMYITAGSEDSSVYVWEAGQGKAYGGLRGAGNKVSRNATKQFAEAAHEYWHTNGGAVTCSVVAPLLTHKHLDASEDPIMRRSWRHEIEQARTASSRPLSSLTLSSAITAALPIAFRSGPGRQQVNARLNRIVVTADDTSCVQVWRTDSFQLLGSIAQPMTPMMNNASNNDSSIDMTGGSSSSHHSSVAPAPAPAATSPALNR
ncbi:hypothetical protein A4X06_0g7945 [Tilletia controversa]|uniref:WD repeat-containing protein 44 n=1 Tax=Tilletia controversa TaxID=13291 RepID=A0A8X7STQ5_9BASI|nr:hypothetical protein CF328_g7232 [Tilletia controversa]KAE8240000.1 hypothetical protein A4X06_0g7945 [Tilletia controversa]CAD6984389.1 unnamed protein product [Tilletia controversa]